MLVKLTTGVGEGGRQVVNEDDRVDREDVEWDLCHAGHPDVGDTERAR